MRHLSAPRIPLHWLAFRKKEKYGSHWSHRLRILGANLVRNFAEAADTQVIAVADMRSDRLQLAKRRYPGIEAVLDYRDLLKNREIDAIAISTPVSTHFQLAMEALQAGKHVLVEKPMTASSYYRDASHR